MPSALAIHDGPDSVRPERDVELEAALANEQLARGDRDRAMAERDAIKHAARQAFLELFGDRELDFETVLAAWRAVRHGPTEKLHA